MLVRVRQEDGRAFLTLKGRTEGVARAEFEYVNKLFLHHIPKRGLDSAEKLAKKKLGFDFTSASPLTSIAKAKCPVLFVHGKADTFIPYSTSEELYNACPT